MRNIDNHDAFTLHYHTFIEDDEPHGTIHTMTASDKYPLFETGDTVSVEEEYYIVTSVMQHGKLDRESKHFLYFVQRNTDMESIQFLSTLLS